MNFVNVIFLMFYKCVPYAHFFRIYLIKITGENSNVVKYYYNFKYFVLLFWYIYDVIHFCDGKAEFSAAITPVLNVTWFFRNHSNMLIWCSQKNIIIINVFPLAFDTLNVSLINKSINFLQPQTFKQ